MFSHEKLAVYPKAIAFVAWTQPIIEDLPARMSARDQLERASTSIPLNIAEGNAKFSIPDRARYLQSALGSAVESAACLDVLVARGSRSESDIASGKQMLEVIVSMLLGLLDRFGYRYDAQCRIREDDPEG